MLVCVCLNIIYLPKNVLNFFFSSLHLVFQAAVSGLQNQPIINAVIDGDDIIYRDYIDISVAVGTPKVCRHSPVYLGH